MSETKIRYGRTVIDGSLASVAAYKDEEGNEIVLISHPYKDLKAYKNDIEVPVTKVMAYIWTMVAGWIGADELISFAKVLK